MLHGNAADWHSFEGGRWRDLPTPVGNRVGFQLLTPIDTGVAFTNILSDAVGATNRTLYNGSGVAAGDFDGDGLPDLVFAGVNGQVAFFKNLGGWRFTNVTASAGVSVPGLACRGVVLADLDGDGDLDLLLSANGAGVLAFRNDGRGHFEDMTAASGTGSRHGSMTIAVADVDGNGTPDVYIANNRSDDIRDRGQVQLRRVNGQVVVPPDLTNRIVYTQGQILEYGEPDQLFLNDGKGKFSEVSWTSGAFKNEAGTPLSGPPRDWGLTATFRDLNGDGFPDLYVCNDFWTPDRVWMNDGHGHFQAIPGNALRHLSGSSMGVDMADLNHDGRPEIFVVDMLSRSPVLRKRQMPAQNAPFIAPDAVRDRPQFLRNTLFLARSDETYAEIAPYAGVAASEWSWQPLFMDVDLDGEPDLLISTGHAHDVQDRDAEAKVQARQRNLAAIPDPAERRRQFANDLRENMGLYPPLRTPVVAFHNLGGLRFEEVTSRWGTALDGIHHGIAAADFDGDGDLDFVVNNLNGPASLFRNEASAPRLAVRLHGLSPNTAAIGAMVIVRGGGLPEQRQEVVVGGRYLSGSDTQLMFAAGKGTEPLGMEIRWRSGARRTLATVVANRLYELTEDPAIDTQPPGAKPAITNPPPLFEDVSGRLAHTHLPVESDDLLRQPLLPRRLTVDGPEVAWADLDGDGWEDLVIGTGAGGVLGIYRNDGHGGFSQWRTNLVGETRSLSGLLAVPFFKGKHGVIAGVGNTDPATVGIPAVRQFLPEGASADLIAGFESSVGPLALGDYEGKGTLGLFVGGRYKPGRWPEVTASALFRATRNGWQKDEANSRLLQGVGLVTGAVWTDLDNDGFPELVLSCEWGPVRVFKNRNGILEESTRELGLADSVGWWTSVTAGDFDGDGRMDLVAGNWGLNSEYQASPEQPLAWMSGDWNGDGALAVIETVFDPERRSMMASRPLAELLPGLPFLAGKYPSHQNFAEASLDEMLGAQRSAAHEIRAVELRSMLFLNRGDHFEGHPLPIEAQLTPVRGLAVTDFDGDGNEDVFLAQNFFGVRPGQARLDAGRGLLLRGDGSGGFQAVEGGLSGVRIYGQQGGAAVADFDHDGRPDLVVGVQGGATRLLLNRTGNPGVRVRLKGPPGNPDGIGAVLRWEGEAPHRPAREVGAGHGAGSQNSPVTLLTRPGNSGLRLRIAWPGGKTSTIAVPPDASQCLGEFPGN
jgi:hypothetical protein